MAAHCGEYEDGESEPIFMARRWFDRHGYRPAVTAPP